MHHLKINELAKNIADKIIKEKEIFKANIVNLANNSTILDMTNASWEGGKLVGEICMGGLGSVIFSHYNLDGHFLPSVIVHTSEPLISCMASQLAGWNVKLKKEVEKDGQ
ncbi:MAG: methenyltetrahydromethanopterin cyclohydrolase, partial [Candidatus Hermodarchaeota archaeon]